MTLRITKRLISIAALAVFLPASSVVAEEGGPQPRRFDFETSVTPWQMSVGRAEGVVFEQSFDAPHQGRASGVLRLPDGGASGAAALVLSGEPYRGRTVRLRAWLRAQGVDAGLSGLWLRVDRAKGRPGYFNNMAGRPVRSDDWSEVSLVAEVPDDATVILLGVIRSGQGMLWIDDLDFGPVAPEDFAGAHSEARQYLLHAIDILRSTHMRRDQVDWDALTDGALAQIRTAVAPGDTHDAIRRMIADLGEPHTFLRAPAPPSDIGPAAALPEQAVAGDVAVIRLPGWSSAARQPSDVDPYEKRLKDFASQDRCGFIIDLRADTGGDMWPMLNGLRPVLGAGPYGYFIQPVSQPRAWTLDGQGRIAIADQTSPAGATDDRPLAVLFGPRTASAGEMVAVALNGRNRSRSFGQPTFGFTTANLSTTLSDGAVLGVTGARVADRAMTVVDGPLAPDVTTSTPLDDALSWLESEGCEVGDRSGISEMR